MKLIKLGEKFKKWFLKNGLYYRIFWSIILALSLWQFTIICILTWHQFFAETVSIGIDTSYLEWRNTFPSMSICLIKSRIYKPVLDYIKEMNLSIPAKLSEINYAKNLQDYIFSTPIDINVKPRYCKDLNNTCGVDILQLRDKLLPHSCEEFMVNVTYLGKTYTNCSKFFHFHRLEMGYCYLANNFLDYQSIEALPLKYGIRDIDRSLSLYLKSSDLFWKYQMYFHSPENLPYFNDFAYEIFFDSNIFHFDVVEYHNHEEIIGESPQQRFCRFPSEKELDSEWPYSLSTCLSNLRIKMELRKCNCTHFTAPKRYKNYYCDLEGMKCLIKAGIPTLTKNYMIHHKSCFQSCTAQQINFVGVTKRENLEVSNYYYLEGHIINLPTLRYKRSVRNTYLDLIVSVGSIIGLFAGFSAINFLEILYLLLRPSTVSLNKK